MRITDQLVSQLAAEADADRRSITRALAGLPVRGRAGHRVARALEAHGLAPQSPTSSQPPPPQAA